MYTIKYYASQSHPILSHLNQAYPILSDLRRRGWAKRNLLSSVQCHRPRSTRLPGHGTCRLSCGRTPLHLDQKEHLQVESRHPPCEYVTTRCAQTQLRGFLPLRGNDLDLLGLGTT